MYRVSPERDGTISMEMQTPNRTQNSKLCQTHLHLHNTHTQKDIQISNQSSEKCAQ